MSHSKREERFLIIYSIYLYSATSNYHLLLLTNHSTNLPLLSITIQYSTNLSLLSNTIYSLYNLNYNLYCFIVLHKKKFHFVRFLEKKNDGLFMSRTSHFIFYKKNEFFLPPYSLIVGLNACNVYVFKLFSLFSISES